MKFHPRVLALIALGPHSAFAAMALSSPQSIELQGAFLLVGFIAAFTFLQAINACEAFDEALNALPFINANNCPTIALIPSDEDDAQKRRHGTERPHTLLSLLIGLTAGWAASGLILLVVYVPLSNFVSEKEAAAFAYCASLAVIFASTAWTASLIDTITAEGSEQN